MQDKSIRLGDLILVIDDISLVLSGDIICRFHLSHKNEPKHSLVEMYAELSDDGELEVVCRTPLTTNRFEIVSRFLHLYEKNIIRFFREHTQGKTPYMFKVPMS
ncbi:MAG: hypothetical protein RIG61_11865 [Deltaproteobacteria bacterium]